jgi:hypothetical protein
MEASLPWSLEL